MKKIIVGILCCLLSVFVMSHNTYAIDYSYNVRLYDSTLVAEYQESGNRYYGAITGPAIWGTFTIVFNRSITTYDGLLLDIPFYIWNYQENNSVDGYANLRNIECQGGNINCTVIGQEYGGSGTGQLIHNYIYVSSVGSLDRVTFSVPSGYNQYSLRLFADERFVVPYISGFRLVDNNGATSSDIAALGQSLTTISNKMDIIINQTNYLDDILTDIGSTNYKLDQIGNRFDALNLQISSLNSKTQDIVDNTSNMSDYVDEQRQAYENMQDTDGLIDIGDQTQALSIVGSINSVLGQVNAIPAAANCVLTGDLGVINLGNLDFCQGKENFAWIVTFVATGIFLVISFFICIRVIKKVLRVISWARRN